MVGGEKGEKSGKGVKGVKSEKGKIQKTEDRRNEEKMNIEHSTFNIERRIKEILNTEKKDAWGKAPPYRRTAS